MDQFMSMPALILTSNDREKNVRIALGLGLGISDFIAKSFKRADLLLRIKKSVNFHLLNPLD